MNKPQITIKDIARALNVSPSTVSRALKDNPDISRETRDLIHAYAREHNYKPNVLAVNLRASRSNTIGVIVPQLVHHFFSCVLSGIEKAAAEAGYNILVAQSNESYEQEVKIVHSFLAARVCGVIASLAKDTSQYDDDCIYPCTCAWDSWLCSLRSICWYHVAGNLQYGSRLCKARRNSSICASCPCRGCRMFFRTNLRGDDLRSSER